MSWIYNLDLLGSQPKLFIKGKNMYPTMFGAILTIMTYILIAVISTYFLIDFLQGNGQTILSYLKASEPININFAERPFMFYLRNKNGLVDPRLLEIKLFTKINNSTSTGIDIQEIETKICKFGNQIGNSTELDTIQNLVESATLICPKSNISLKDDFIKKEKILILVRPCQNSSLNNNSCLPQEQIDNFVSEQKYMKLRIVLFTFNNFILNSFKSSPVSEEIIKLNVWINTDSTRTQKVYYRKINYDSDDDWLFLKVKNYQAYFLDESLTSNETGLKDPNTIFVLYIEPYTKHTIYYFRTYPKLRHLLPQINAVFSFTIFISGLINELISGQKMEVDIFNHIFHNEYILRREDKCVELKQIESINYARDSFNREKLSLDVPIKKREKLRTGLAYLILPKLCVKDKIRKELINSSEIFYRKFLSCENVIKNLLDVQKFRRLLFSLDQRNVIDHFDNKDNQELLDYLINSFQENDEDAYLSFEKLKLHNRDHLNFKILNNLLNQYGNI